MTETHMPPEELIWGATADMQSAVSQARSVASASSTPLYFWPILTIALAARLAVVGVILSRNSPESLFDKPMDLTNLAQSLNAGHGLSSPFGGSTGPSAFLAPGYPLLVASLFHCFGPRSLGSALALFALQILFAVLTVALMMRVAHRIFGALTANLAGLAWALSIPIICLSAVFWETTLSALLLTGSIALALRISTNPGKGLWALLGGTIGLSMLVNPSLTLVLFAVFAWAFNRTRPARRYEAWICVLLCLVVFLPWPIRNAYQLHAFIPLRSNFGYELWQGNHPGSSGVFQSQLFPIGNLQEYSGYATKGEVTYMRDKSALGKAYIRAHPAQFIKLSLKRVGRFWVGAGYAHNSGLIELHAVITSILGLIGLGFLFKRRASLAILFLLPLLIFPLPYYITHPDFRFRILLDPLLTILGAYALSLAYSAIKRHRKLSRITDFPPSPTTPFDYPLPILKDSRSS